MIGENNEAPVCVNVICICYLILANTLTVNHVEYYWIITLCTNLCLCDSSIIIIVELVDVCMFVCLYNTHNERCIPEVIDIFTFYTQKYKIRIKNAIRCSYFLTWMNFYIVWICDVWICNWGTQSQSGLTLLIFIMELTHFGSKASICNYYIMYHTVSSKCVL